MVVADDVLRRRSSTQPVPVAGYRNQDMREYAEQVIDDMGGLPYRRASRTQAEPCTTSTRQRYQQPHSVKPAERADQVYQYSALDTDQDEEIVPSVLQQYYAQPRSRWHPSQWHPLVSFGSGMLVLLVLWFFGVRLYAWSTNTFYDPGYYTQTSHRDTVVVTDAEGHRFQVHAFVDPQSHLDLLIMPVDGPANKARVVRGPTLYNIDNPPQRAMLIVTARDTMITVLAQGPLQAEGLATARQSTGWTTDLNAQQPSGQGGS